MEFKDNLINSEYSMSVDTDKLNTKAQQLKDICIDILLRIENIKSYVQDSEYYWNSDSATLLRTLFDDDKKEIDSIVISLKKQVDKLELISSNYKSSEESNVEECSALPNSILE